MSSLFAPQLTTHLSVSLDTEQSGGLAFCNKSSLSGLMCPSPSSYHCCFGSQFLEVSGAKPVALVEPAFSHVLPDIDQHTWQGLAGSGIPVLPSGLQDLLGKQQQTVL